VSAKQKELSKERLVVLQDARSAVQTIVSTLAKSDAEMSEAAAGEIIEKYSGRQLANDATPPLDLVTALRRLNTTVPCEHQGPYQPGGYHKNLDGMLKGFSSADNRQAWYEKRYDLVVRAGSWKEIEIENCDADFTLQYGVKGFKDKQANTRGNDDGKQRKASEHFSMGAIVQQVNDNCEKSEQVYQEARDAARDREPEAYQRLISEFPTYYGPGSKKLKQSDTTTMQLYRSALSTLPILWEVATEIAGKDAVSVKWSIKGLDRLAKKVLQKYDGEVAQVTDVCRVSIVFERIEGLVAALERLSYPYNTTGNALSTALVYTPESTLLRWVQ
jgi:hypothetical protein